MLQASTELEFVNSSWKEGQSNIQRQMLIIMMKGFLVTPLQQTGKKRQTGSNFLPWDYVARESNSTRKKKTRNWNSLTMDDAWTFGQLSHAEAKQKSSMREKNRESIFCFSGALSFPAKRRKNLQRGGGGIPALMRNGENAFLRVNFCSSNFTFLGCA